jgi:tryptophanyl-tRNA synthetase
MKILEEETISRQEFDELIDWSDRLKEDFNKLKSISDQYDETDSKETKKELIQEFLNFLEDSETLEQRMDKISTDLRKIVRDLQKKLG